MNLNNLVNPNKTTQENYFQKKFALVDSFGTIKAKKIMASMKTLNVKETYTDSIDTVTKAIQESSKISEDAIANNSGIISNFYFFKIDEQNNSKLEKMKEILPEFDLDAKESKDIYNIKSSKFILINKSYW